MTATVPAAPAAPSPAPTSGRRTVAWGRLVRRALLNVLLLAIALVWLLPAVGLLVTSFRPAQDYFASGWWKALSEPSRLTLDNYRRIMETQGIDDALVTTALITVPTTLLVVVVSALAAYALVFLPWRGREVAFLVIVALMVVPLQMALIPVASLYGRLGLFGTLTGVVLFHTAFGLPFGIFLMRNFYTGIPAELLEAARIDGASDLRMFLRIVLPIGRPALASLGIFQFLWVWNDLLVALVMLGGSSQRPITVAIFSQLRQFGTNIDLISAAAFVSMIVPLAVFFAFQRSFVRGVLAGAVK